jgi:hypothetical protein
MTRLIRVTVWLLLAVCLLAGVGLICRADDKSIDLNSLQGPSSSQIAVSAGAYDVYNSTPTWIIIVPLLVESVRGD